MRISPRKVFVPVEEYLLLRQGLPVWAALAVQEPHVNVPGVRPAETPQVSRHPTQELCCRKLPQPNDGPVGWAEVVWAGRGEAGQATHLLQVPSHQGLPLGRQRHAGIFKRMTFIFSAPVPTNVLYFQYYRSNCKKL